jgi:hypothetical protein
MQQHLPGILLTSAVHMHTCSPAHLRPFTHCATAVPQAKLRIGLAEQSVLVAIAHAVLLHKEGAKDK